MIVYVLAATHAEAAQFAASEGLDRGAWSYVQWADQMSKLSRARVVMLVGWERGRPAEDVDAIYARVGVRR